MGVLEALDCGMADDEAEIYDATRGKCYTADDESFTREGACEWNDCACGIAGAFMTLWWASLGFY